MNLSFNKYFLLCTIAYLTTFVSVYAKDLPIIKVKSFKDQTEVENLIKQTQRLATPQKRIEFISASLLGRKYHPDTRKRIKKQKKKKTKNIEATNEKPLRVKILPSNLNYLDCMTYVEHVLALAASHEASYRNEFLPRLVDVMYCAKGQSLMNHHRNHFTSVWADNNEEKGYLKNVARKHPKAIRKTLILNKVGNNRTFYVKDRFMISKNSQTIWYFDRQTILNKEIKLRSGDVVAMVTGKKGLDVTHMGFYIENKDKKLLRHASYKLNLVIDQDFYKYLEKHDSTKGLMVFRPVLTPSEAYKYEFQKTYK
jgi:hypothetical protein